MTFPYALSVTTYRHRSGFATRKQNRLRTRLQLPNLHLQKTDFTEWQFQAAVCIPLKLSLASMLGDMPFQVKPGLLGI